MTVCGVCFMHSSDVVVNNQSHSAIANVMGSDCFKGLDRIQYKHYIIYNSNNW